MKIFSDGGARGNPGPAAIAFVILSEKGETLIRFSRYIGSRTNNQAEYEALNSGLESAVTLGADEVICYLDSQLATKQLNGEYLVRNLELRKLWKRTQELRKKFKKATFIRVPRTNIRIQEADQLLNETLDKKFM